MILDTLDQSSQYSALSPKFKKAFDFLRQVNASTPVGRYEIDGDDVFAFVQQNRTKPIEEQVYEAHRKHIDVQYVIRGREIIYWAPLSLLKNITVPFSEEDDASLHALIPEGMPIPLREGQFVILFPQDGHAPSCMWDQPEDVLKVVVKLKV